MPLSHTPVEVFCSYAPEDEEYCQQLENHLWVLKREELISFWHHRKILPGSHRRHTIDLYLESASVIVLLISPDFLASDCCDVEMQQALKRHKAGEARVIPVLLRPTDNWQEAPFGHLAPLPTNTQPVTKWANEDEAFADIAAGIRRAIADLSSPIATVPPHQVTVRDPAEVGKYRVEYKGPVQGPVIGDYTTIHQHFYSSMSSTSPTATPECLWTIPYPCNPFFTGREDLLDQLTSELQKGYVTALSQPQAISGLGGVGKTQLAIEYAYRHRGDYQAVLWARVESQEALTTSLLILAEKLCLPESRQQDAAITTQAVKSWLQRKTGWLLILDNADELDVVHEFLSPTLGGHVLLTTRAQAMGQLAHKIEVEPFTPELGAHFLLQRAIILAQDAPFEQASASNRELALRITHELDGLPLALDQAGAYVEETGCSLADYQQLYQRHQTTLLKRRGRRTSDHPEPVGTTWLLAFARLESTHPAAADLLRLCAFLAPEAIPEKLLTAAASHLGEPLALVAAEQLLLNEAVESLRAYSLLSRDSQTSTVSVHRLVQKVVRDALPTEEQTAWMLRVVLAMHAASPDWQDVTQRSTREGWLPHMLACATRLVEQGQMEFPLEVTYPLNSLATLYSELGKYREAEPLCRRCLDIREQRLGRDHPDVAPLLNNLAILCKVQGKYKEAEELYQHSLHIWEQSLGPEHPNVAQSLNNLAVLYAELGRYEEAKELFERSLRIRERILGPEHLDVAQSLSNLANLYTEQGKYAEAESLYQRSLHIFKQNRRSEHPDVAYLRNGLGILYKVQGRYEEAEQSYQHSLRIWEQILGPEHPQVAYSLHNLAVLYTEQGKYAEAQEPESKYEKAKGLFERSLDIWKQNLGLKHLHTQICAKNYAGLLHILKRDADARELERQYFFSDELLDELLILETYLKFLFE